MYRVRLPAAGIRPEAIQANHFALLPAHCVLSGSLAAEFAKHGREFAGRRRAREHRFGKGKNLLERRGENMVLPLLPRHARGCLPPEIHPQPPALLSIKKRIGVLAGAVEHEIALAYRTTQKALDRIHTASVVLRNATKRPIGSPGKIRMFQNMPAGPHSNSQSRASMPVKRHCLGPNLLKHQFPSLPEHSGNRHQLLFPNRPTAADPPGTPGPPLVIPEEPAGKEPFTSFKEKVPCSNRQLAPSAVDPAAAGEELCGLSLPEGGLRKGLYRLGCSIRSIRP